MRAMGTLHQDRGTGIRGQFTRLELRDELDLFTGEFPEMRQSAQRTALTGCLKRMSRFYCRHAYQVPRDGAPTRQRRSLKHAAQHFVPQVPQQPRDCSGGQAPASLSVREIQTHFAEPLGVVAPVLADLDEQEQMDRLLENFGKLPA